MKRYVVAVIVAAAAAAASAVQLPPVTVSSPARPSPQQLAWQDYELGMFVHIAPQTWQDSEEDNRSTPLNAINPDRLDTDQWVQVAQSMGAKYIVFVAKHEGGFCWWQTDTTDFGVRNTPWRGGKGDVLADLAAACRKAGMKLGVYLSPQDRTHGIAGGGRAKDPAQQAAYEKLFRQQLTEVLSKYGEMVEVWFDGSLVFDVGDILAKHAPNAVVFQGPQASIRWVGNEDGVAPYPAWNAVKYPDPAAKWGDYTAAQSRLGGDLWLPLECDARIRATWFWKTDNERTLKSVDRLMDMYYRSVGHGATLLLNVTPDRSGRMPDADALRAAEFGTEIRRRIGTALAERANYRVYGEELSLTLMLGRPTAVEHFITMENLKGGEQVVEYVIEGHADGAWRELVRGSAVGHKKIDRIHPLTIDGVRLWVPRKAATVDIRRFAVFAATELPR